MNTSRATVARVLLIGASLLPNNLHGLEGQQFRPVRMPQVPVMPQQPYQPQPVYQQPVYQQSVNQPQPVYRQMLLGTNCYAGQVFGTLGQAAPIGTSCYVVAYGATYQGTVGQ